MKNNRLKKPLAVFLMLTLVLTTCSQPGIYSVAVNADETAAVAGETVSDSEISDSVQSEAVEEASSAETENDQAVPVETESGLTESIADENNQPESDGAENQSDNQTEDQPEGQAENQDGSQTAEDNSSEPQNPEQDNQTDNTSSEETAEPDNNAEPDDQSSQKDNDTAESSEADDFGDGIDGEDGTEDSKAEEQQPDLSADVETADVWEASLPKAGELTGVYTKDILAAAKSQLGYTESTKNYQVQEDGQTKKGYTRYGAWYGEPYIDWSAVFASFCLHYAGIPESVFPQKASCPQWIELLSAEKYNLFRKAGSYVPKPGDLVFFDKDHDGEADHVGIVSELTKNGEILTEDLDTETPDGIKVIEGDVSAEGDTSDSVKELKYSINDIIIMGYGSLTDAQPDSTEEADESANDEQQTGEQKTDEQEENSGDEPETDSDQITKKAVSGAYTVTVTYNKEANIPDDAKLVAEKIETTDEDLLALKENIAEADSGEAEIVPAETETGTSENADVQNEESDEEAELVSADTETGEADDENVQAAGQKTFAETVSLFRLKIGFMKGSEEIEPESTVSVRVDVEGGLNIPDDAQVGIVHYKDDGNVVEVIQDVKISSEGTTETMAFNLDSFSTVEGYYQTMAEDDTEETYNGYVSALSASITADGTAKFTEAGKGSTDGKDENGQNGVVRTFDSVEYGLQATFASMNNETVKETTLHFEMTLPMGITEAEFDLSKMGWLGNDYLIEYLDEKGEVVGYKDSTCKEGEYYTTAKEKIYVNTTATGSDGGENGSYKISNIVSQRITGYENLGSKDSEKDVIPGTQDLSAGVKVLDAKNGQLVEPEFKVWLDNNTDNLGYDASNVNKTGNATAQATNVTKMNGTYDGTNKTGAVTVSAGPLYNMAIDDNSNLTYIGWFDFSTGKELTASSTDIYTVNGKEVTAAKIYELLEALGNLQENYGKPSSGSDKANPVNFTNTAGNETVEELLGENKLSDYKAIFQNIRYGRMYGYGISLQLANTNKNGEYGMKGLSLPQGTISLDLKMYTKTTSTSESGSTSVKVDPAGYDGIIWDYYQGNSKTGALGRNFRWNNNDSTTYSMLAAPYFNTSNQNSTFTEENSCYQSGEWKLTGIDQETVDVTTSSSTGGNAIYHFEVSGYDFDLDDYTFPVQKVGNANTDGAYGKYEYPFSTGYIQVLSVFPRVSGGTVTETMTVNVGNVNITSISDQNISEKLTEDKGGSIHHDYETNTAGGDNVITTSVVFYRPGEATKQNSFTTQAGKSVYDGFLGQTGTEDTFWVTSWDAAAFAGDKIAINGNLYMKSDDRLKAYNYLQLFDKNLEIDESNINEEKRWVSSKDAASTNTDQITVILMSGTCESAKILYAADPKYRTGYDTNVDSVLEYMNSVQEEDLIYFNSLNELEAEGYTCVGVLAEVRGVSGLEWGYNGFCGLRIPVKVKEDPDLVGKTVATVNTARIWMGEGDMDGVSWSNNDQTGYVTPDYNLYNGGGEPYENYVKVRYENGNITSDSHTGGYICGNSLLILGYRAGIKIDSEKPEGSKSYNLANETGVVTYTLSGIKTNLEVGATAGEGSTTSLDINLDLTGHDSNGKNLTGDDLDVYLFKGSYSLKMQDGTVKLSESEGNPTTIYYKIVNGAIQFSKTELEGGKSMTLWVDSTSSDGRTAAIHISGAPVGYELPDITSKAQLGNRLSNGAKITATATIGGTGDCRAYEKVNGNYSTDTVGIISLGASGLTKTRDKRLTELNGDVTYTITYSNKGDSSIGKLYLYDLLPYNDDGRGTKKEGNTLLTAVSATIVDSSGNEAENLGKTQIRVYYSTVSQETLDGIVKGFNGNDSSAIENMLKGNNFKSLGTLKDSLASLTADKDIQSKITCVYAVAENLGANCSLKLNLTMDTENNESSNTYGNLAYGYSPDKGSDMQTPIVQTTVVSRSISGRVWFDSDWDGVYDAGEPLVSNVECTLFKWDKEAEEYKVCKTDVTGETISSQTTSENGAYNFTGLADGKYVVAFKLKDGCTYKDEDIGATTYQVKGGNDSNNNDGVALGKTKSDKDKEEIEYKGISAGEYAFAIAYSLSGTTPENMPLHTIEDYGKYPSYLKNYQENYEHQDLGLSYGSPKKLPTTGGMGTYLFTIGGTALVTAAVLLFARSKRKGAGKKRRR